MPEPLGVPLMDRDHAALERLFAEAGTAPDAALPALFERIARELAEHFAREEALMTEARVPVLLRHLELHAQLLSDVDRMRRDMATTEPESARQIVGTLLPLMVAQHVATADTVSASFLVQQNNGRPAADPFIQRPEATRDETSS